MATLLFFDISFGEIFIVIIVIFIIFGPERIPEFARKFGKGMRQIKKASTDIQREINKEVRQYKTDLDMEKMVTESESPEKTEKINETTPPVKENKKNEE